MNRRSFLSRSLLSAASFGIGSALSRGRRGRYELSRSAEAAPLPTPYPVLLIAVHGGLDPAMHMVATPNGNFGNVNVVNRLPDSGSFVKTAKDILYVPSVVTPTGNDQFKAHLDDVALIRLLRLNGNHGDTAAIWFGDRAAGEQNYGRLAWASQLTAQFRRRGVIVPKPCAVAYGKAAENLPYQEYITWGTQSPDPATIADRILSLSGYFNSFSAGGNLPRPEVQSPAYALVDALDQRVPSATQPDYTQRFAAANGTATHLLTTVRSGPDWPPKDDVLRPLGVNAADLNKPIGELSYEQMFAFAAQALKQDVAHVVALAYSPGGQWDSHNANAVKQRISGNALWPAVGKLLATLKTIKSPIDVTKTLFDTTNIWIQSEMGRTSTAQMGDGTDHWEWGSATFLGGRFKRGIAIGGYSPDWKALPINPTTGTQAGGIELRMNNAIATVMKAAGGDPSEFTNAAPVDAILDMSL